MVVLCARDTVCPVINRPASMAESRQTALPRFENSERCEGRTSSLQSSIHVVVAKIKYCVDGGVVNRNRL